MPEELPFLHHNGGTCSGDLHRALPLPMKLIAAMLQDVKMAWSGSSATRKTCVG